MFSIRYYNIIWKYIFSRISLCYCIHSVVHMLQHSEKLSPFKTKPLTLSSFFGLSPALWCERFCREKVGIVSPLALDVACWGRCVLYLR